MDNTSHTLSSNKTFDFDKLNHEKVIDQLFILIFYIIILVIGIIGNMLVLFVYKHKLKRSSARVYIISLALTDLCVCTVGIPYTTLDNIWNQTYRGVCEVLSFCMSVGSLSSVFLLLLIGLDRYLKVCRPLKRQIKDFGDKKACIITILAAFIFGLPVLELYGENTVTDERGIKVSSCFVDDEYNGSMLATIYFLLHIFIFIAAVMYLCIVYGFIYKTIYEHDKMEGAIIIKKDRRFCRRLQYDIDDDDEDLNKVNCKNSTDCIGISLKSLRQNGRGESNDAILQSDRCSRKNNYTSSEHKEVEARSSSKGMQRHSVGKKLERTTRKITLMMFTIAVVFIVAYLPFVLISILSEIMKDYWKNMGILEESVHEFLLRLYVVNNVANPLIYCFWDKRYRTECVQFVKKVFLLFR